MFNFVSSRCLFMSGWFQVKWSLLLCWEPLLQLLSVETFHMIKQAEQGLSYRAFVTVCIILNISQDKASLAEPQLHTNKTNRAGPLLQIFSLTRTLHMSTNKDKDHQVGVHVQKRSTSMFEPSWSTKEGQWITVIPRQTNADLSLNNYGKIVFLLPLVPTVIFTVFRTENPL